MHTVLIIDDSDINLTLIKALVLKLGECNPVLFDKPLAALEWCRSNEPDLVIVDYMMPDMDGLKFIAAFRALHGKTWTASNSSRPSVPCMAAMKSRS